MNKDNFDIFFNTLLSHTDLLREFETETFSFNDFSPEIRDLLYNDYNSTMTMNLPTLFKNPIYINAFKHYYIECNENFIAKEMKFPKINNTVLFQKYFLIFETVLDIGESDEKIIEHLKMLFKKQNIMEEKSYQYTWYKNVLHLKLKDDFLNVCYEAFKNDSIITEQISNYKKVYDNMKIEKFKKMVNNFKEDIENGKNESSPKKVNLPYFKEEILVPFYYLSYFLTSMPEIFENNENEFEFDKIFNLLTNQQKKALLNTISCKEDPIKEYLIKTYFQKEAIEKTLKDN